MTHCKKEVSLWLLRQKLLPKNTEEEQLIDKEAVRIMTVCKATESSQIGDFMRRRQFAEKKISDLTEREKRLKKGYHDLKFIEKHIRDTEYRIEQEIYRQSKTRSLDDLISHANKSQRKILKIQKFL